MDLPQDINQAPDPAITGAPASQNVPSSVADLLGQIGLDIETNVDGYYVVDHNKTSRNNTFQLLLHKDPKATRASEGIKAVFVGKQSIQDGCLRATDQGKPMINTERFEGWINRDQQFWLRDRTNQQELKVM